jgi:hypothetical protein
MIGVLGSGFFFRQVARGLVGFIPGWGILPKIAIAYAGTYLVGQGVTVWLRDGQKLTGRELERFYSEALTRGKKWAASLRRDKKTPSQSSELPGDNEVPKSSKTNAPETNTPETNAEAASTNEKP